MSGRAPRGDRGGRGGRGGDGGGRGGRGRGGGDRGRGGGDRGRGGGDRGRGGGDRGRGGGDRGGRGGFDRGRGGFDRGGRGRGGRGRGGIERYSHLNEPTVWGDGKAPEPDSEISKLEDTIVSSITAAAVATKVQQTEKGKGKGKGKGGKGKAAAQPAQPAQPAEPDLPAKMAGLTLGSTIGSLPGTEVFPARPGYVSLGVKVKLYANYFDLKLPTIGLYKYTVEVKRLSETWIGEGPAPTPAPTRRGTGEVTGRRLEEVIHKLLAVLEAEGNRDVTTEFRSKLVSKQPLDYRGNRIDGNNDTIAIADEKGNYREDFEVKIAGPFPIDLGQIMQYLNTQRNYTGSFPVYEEEADALNVMMGFPSRQDPVVAAVGRSRFYPLSLNNEKFNFIGDSIRAVHRGYFQSVRPATGRLVLNVNVTCGLFRAAENVATMLDRWGLNGAAMSDVWAQKRFKSFSQQLFRARVKVTVGKQQVVKEKVVIGLAFKWDYSRQGKKPPQFTQAIGGPTHVSFFMKGKIGPRNERIEEYITVSDYYLRHYQSRVRPDLPLVVAGSTQNPVFFPAEMCEVLPGQPVGAKATPEETRDMIEFACRSPWAGANSITNVGRTALHLDDGALKNFEVQVGKGFITVNARILPPPTLKYLQKTISPRDGAWNMAGIKVVEPGRIATWMWLHITYSRDVNFHMGQSPPEVKPCCEQFHNQMKNSMGINVGQLLDGPTLTITRNFTTETIQSAFRAIGQRPQKPDFLMVILPDDGARLYNMIKYVGDCVVGVPTLCIKADNLRKQNVVTYANVALKWNLKGMGINHRLAHDVALLQDNKTMIVGYDVTHPMRAGRVTDPSKDKSLVGIVASMDSHLGQWPSRSWVQAGGQEMLLADQLEAKFGELLDLWCKWKGRPRAMPQNIIIYRDGVSEGQFTQVLEKEIPHIRSACQKRGKVLPKFTVLVSVKRHNTRFFPADENQMDQKSRNIKSGTIVDRGITLAGVWDFYLTAHTALKGTARPAHYTVLLDEVFRTGAGKQPNRTPADVLAEFTLSLCFLFGRATKAVSIVPPAYYADLLCTRLRCHRFEIYDDVPSDTASTTGSDSGFEAVHRRAVHERLMNTMYYL